MVQAGLVHSDPAEPLQKERADCGPRRFAPEHIQEKSGADDEGGGEKGA